MAQDNSTGVAANSPARHLVQYQFKKGQSGNPHGRPKLPPELRKAFKPALKFTAELIENTAEDTSQRRQAAADVIAYHLGKPGAELLDDGDDVPHERPALVAKALDRIAEWYPAVAKELASAKAKILEPTEGEAQCAEESQR